MVRWSSHSRELWVDNVFLPFTDKRNWQHGQEKCITDWYATICEGPNSHKVIHRNRKKIEGIINKTHICASVSLCSSVVGPQSVNTKNYLQATSFMSTRKRDKAGTRGAVRTSSRYVYRSHQMWSKGLQVRSRQSPLAHTYKHWMRM